MIAQKNFLNPILKSNPLKFIIIKKNNFTHYSISKSVH